MADDDEELAKGTPSAPETSRWGPGMGHAPTFAASKLRARAAAGLGEAGALQLAVTRMMRVNSSEDPRQRPMPHVVTLEDVTRGLGLESGDDQRIQTLIRDTTVRSTPKTQTQHMLHARGRLLSTMRGSMVHVDADTRDEVLRRAVAWWKRTEQTDYGKPPTVRYRGGDARKSMTPVLPRMLLGRQVAPKLVILEKGQARGGKYYRRVPKAGGGYRYYYTKEAYESAHGAEAHANGPDVVAARRKALEDKAREVIGNVLDRLLGQGWRVQRADPKTDPANSEMESYVGASTAQQLINAGVALVRASADASPTPKATTRMSPERELGQMKRMMASATEIRGEMAQLRQTIQQLNAKPKAREGSPEEEAYTAAYGAYLDAQTTASRAHQAFERYKKANPRHFDDKGVPHSEEAYAFVERNHAETLTAIREARAASRAALIAAVPVPKQKRGARPQPSPQLGFDFAGVEAKPSGDSVQAAPAEPPAPTPAAPQAAPVVVPPKPAPAPPSPSEGSVTAKLAEVRARISTLVRLFGSEEAVLAQNPKLAEELRTLESAAATTGAPPPPAATPTSGPSGPSGPSAQVILSNRWTNGDADNNPVYAAGLVDTKEDVGFTRGKLTGTLSQFRAAVAALEALRPTYKGSDLRSLNTAIGHLQEAADRVDPEVQRRRKAEADARFQEYVAEQARKKAAAESKTSGPSGRTQKELEAAAAGALGARLNTFIRDGWKVVPLVMPPSGKTSDLEMLGPLPGAKVDLLVERGVMLTRGGAPAEAPKPQKPKLTIPREPPKGTPRADGAAETKRMVEEKEYVNDRSSAVEQRGEDVLGSARHKALEWKSMREALERSDAGEMFTRDFLMKQEPDDFMGPVQSGKANPVKAVFLFHTLRKLGAMPEMVQLPKARDGSPNSDYEIAYLDGKIPFTRKKGSGEGVMGYGRRGFYQRPGTDAEVVSQAEHEKRQRESYYEAWSQIRGVVERHLADPESNMNQVRAQVLKDLNGWLEARRDSHSGRDAGFEAGRKLYNALGARGKNSPLKQAGEFVQKLFGAERKGSTARASEYALKVLEGKSLNQAFGTVQKRADKDIDLSKLYNTSVMKRVGPPSEYHGVEQGLDLLDKRTGGKYQMRGVQWGKSLTDDERKHHLKSLVDSWSDLTDVLGLPAEMASFNGRLAIAVGARGKAGVMAHYEPSKKVINLTRANGAGALAHEWGHFFDNIVAEVADVGPRNGLGGKKAEGNFMFERTAPQSVSDAKDEEAGKRYLGPVQREMRDLQQSPPYVAFQAKLREAVRGMVKDGEMAPSKAQYWLSDTEVWARLFERHVQRKLHRAGRENTYLTGLSNEGVSMGLWPNDGEVDAMSPYFDRIFDAFKASPLLKKALDLIRERYQGLVGSKLVVRR